MVRVIDSAAAVLAEAAAEAEAEADAGSALRSDLDPNGWEGHVPSVASTLAATSATIPLLPSQAANLETWLDIAIHRLEDGNHKVRITMC